VSRRLEEWLDSPTVWRLRKMNALLWHDQFVNDEIWLRVRRVLIGRLQASGLALDNEQLSKGLAAQQALGCRELQAMAAELGNGWAAALQSETFLGPAGRRFQLRLPYIVAFGAGYAGVLLALVPGRLSQHSAVRGLSALFNLGIVLVDTIMDDPERFGRFEAIFRPTDLKARLAGVKPSSAPSTSATSEMSVLGQLIDAFFEGVQRLAAGSEPSCLTALGSALSAAYAGQLRSIGAVRDEAAVRAKSVAPFLVAPSLIGLAQSDEDPRQLIAIGTHVGEAFWRIDDLVDFCQDQHRGDPNILALRASSCPDAGPIGISLLETDLLERTATEAVSHFEEALALVTEEAGRLRLRHWLALYALDWLR
jgi:hypothetical protein